ncbi:MAG: SurA N-terminal domain-containing protein [Methyloceanibacter sp.]|uniref:SurA N-terminal domain-containing protein n=1 Tax=Methyloceanibacter sp. TaxID=1965321 RepID=UPI003D9B2243
MVRVQSVIWLLASLTLAVCLIGGSALTQEVSIVVLVNDEPISGYDIEQRERFLAITTKAEPSPALKKQATDLLIDEKLQQQEARKLGINADESDINRILEDMAKKNNMPVDGLAKALGQMGVDIKTLRDRIRSQILWQDVVRRKFRQEVNIGEADVDKALSEGTGEKAETGTPDETTLQLRQVKFEVPSGANQATLAARLAEAEALRARFNSCANVTELANGIQGASVKSLSDQAPASLAQPARLLVLNAKVGQMTPPTLSASGIELYAVCGKRAVRGDATAREQTQKKLMNDEMTIRAERLLRDLKQDAFIEYR